MTCCFHLQGRYAFFSSLHMGADCTRFGILIAVTMIISIFWDATPCSMIESYRRFEWTCCLYLQCRRVVFLRRILSDIGGEMCEIWGSHNDEYEDKCDAMQSGRCLVAKEHSASMFRVFSTRNMKIAISAGTPVIIYKATRCHILGDSDVHIHRYQNVEMKLRRGKDNEINY
jgi:hypothetical protein